MGDPLRDAIRAMVREELDTARAQLAALASDYTSEHLPPGVSRRAYHSACRDIPEAVPTPRGWSCPRSAWAAHARARLERRRRRPPTRTVAAPSTVVDLAERIARRSRATRSGGA